MTIAQAEQLVAAHRTRIIKIVHTYCGSQAEDAVQFACLQLLRHYRRLRADEAHYWLTKVAKNEAIRLYHQQARLTELDADAHELMTHEPDLDAVLDLRDAIARLPPRQARVLLAQASGRSHRELADELGWTPRTIERQVRRGRHTLKELTAA